MPLRIRPNPIAALSGWELPPAIPASEVVKNSFPTDKRNAKWVSPAQVETTRRGYCVYTITKNPGERARKHKVLIHMPPTYIGAFNRCHGVKTLCDCMRHLFVWNYAQDENGIAIRNVTNGEPPVITNPEEIPGACKHQIVALRLLLKANPRWVPPAGLSVKQEVAQRKAVKLTTLHDELTRLRLGQ
jgi:hypothetical protein